MSQVLERQSPQVVPQIDDSVVSPTPAASSPSAAAPGVAGPAGTQFGEFEYRPVPPLVPASAGFLVLSIVAFVWEILILIPVIGLILALIGLRQISRSEGSLSGLSAARGLAAAFGVIIVSAASLHAWTYITEVPTGYQRINFASDISAKGFVVENDVPGLHPDVKKLSGQPVFVKGFMYPSKQQEGLKSFVLCKDSGDCCFGGQPKATDMIRIDMPEGASARFYSGLVAIGGEFLAEPAGITDGLQPVYRVKAKYFGPAKSSY